ncbi:hypothetical protein ABEW34_21635 [Paenibacillus algorifonticola]|uniref:hypothetical protein n=1 Tax=Paenibacillus algorifonticola TaxID=684063 RepID=UPI003D2AB58A
MEKILVTVLAIVFTFGMFIANISNEDDGVAAMGTEQKKAAWEISKSITMPGK